MKKILIAILLLSGLSGYAQKYVLTNHDLVIRAVKNSAITFDIGKWLSNFLIVGDSVKWTYQKNEDNAHFILYLDKDSVTSPVMASATALYDTLVAWTIMESAGGGGGGIADSAWLKLGNAGTVAGTNFIGTTDAVSFVTKTNNTERTRITTTGRLGVGTSTPFAAFNLWSPNTTDSVVQIATNTYGYGIGAASKDTTNGADFNNTTNPLSVFISAAKYPQAVGSAKGGFYRGLYIKIENEILYCTFKSVDTAKFNRGQFGTSIVAHPAATTIHQINPYAHFIDSVGRHGIGTSISDNYLNLAIGNDNWGGVVLGSHNVTQNANGTYGWGGSVTEVTKDFMQHFFFSEGGGLYIIPYAFATGLPQDPLAQLHIGGFAGPLQGGIRIDGTGSIFFTELSGDACQLVGNGTGIKPRGGAGSFADIQAYASSPLRFGTASDNSGQSIRFFPRMGGGWATSVLSIRDNDGGSTSRIFLPVLPTDTVGTNSDSLVWRHGDELMIGKSTGIDTTSGDAATINTVRGWFRKDSSGSTFTLTNSFIKLYSVIMLTPRNAAVDATAVTWTVKPVTGSATITFGAAPSADFDMQFKIE